MIFRDSEHMKSHLPDGGVGNVSVGKIESCLFKALTLDCSTQTRSDTLAVLLATVRRRNRNQEK